MNKPDSKILFLGQLSDIEEQSFQRISSELLQWVRQIGDIDFPSYEDTTKTVTVKSEEQRAHASRYLHALLHRLKIFNKYKNEFVSSPETADLFRDFSDESFGNYGSFDRHCNAAMRAFITASNDGTLATT